MAPGLSMDNTAGTLRIARPSLPSVWVLPILSLPAIAAGALSTGGNFVTGSDNISCTANAPAINRATHAGIIKWYGFSIGDGNPRP